MRIRGEHPAAVGPSVVELGGHRLDDLRPGGAPNRAIPQMPHMQP